MSAKFRLELDDGHARIMLGKTCTKVVRVSDLAAQIVRATDRGPVFPEFIPPCVRWIQERGSLRCVVVEVAPGPRTVRWITDDSPADYGDGVKYAQRRLSLPFLVVILLFQGPGLVDARLFYRNRCLAGPPAKNELYLPNLLNVSDVPGAKGKKTWFCIQYVDVSHVGWYDKIRSVGEHLMFGGFNRSSEHHEGHSYYTDSLKKPCDPRVANVEIWERATLQEPYFALEVNWPPARKTVADVVAEVLDIAQAPRAVETLADLISLASYCPDAREKEGD